MTSLAVISGVNSFDGAIALLERKVGSIEAHDMVLSDPQLIAAEENLAIFAHIDAELFGGRSREHLEEELSWWLR